VYFAAAQGEIDLMERADTWKRLLDTGHFQNLVILIKIFRVHKAMPPLFQNLIIKKDFGSQLGGILANRNPKTSI
jgi:hypothetical protein